MAGEDEDTDLITRETPALINALQELVIKLSPEETGSIPDGDVNLLRKKLAESKKACEVFNLRFAKTTLADLRKKTWPRDIKEILDDISVNLLRGKIKNVISLIEKALTVL
jgi:hypothetical protein